MKESFCRTKIAPTDVQKNTEKGKGTSCSRNLFVRHFEKMDRDSNTRNGKEDQWQNIFDNDQKAIQISDGQNKD